MLFFAAAVAFAQTAPQTPAGRGAGGADAQIRAVLYKQEAAWNRGDTESFLQGYASNATFVGDKVTRGLNELRVRYQSHYPTIASMGHLTFSDLEVHPMAGEYAYVIGHWRIERSADAGGEAGGNFTLIFERTARGWKIILDHTT